MAEHRLSADPSAGLDGLTRQAGVLAHDFNNLMGVILGATEKLAAGAHRDSRERELAEVALEAAERGAELLQRLLALTHGQRSAPVPVDCAAKVPAIVRFAHQIVPTQVAIQASHPSEALFCLADGAALEAAVLNLCVNSGHAMPDGGVLTVDVRGLDLERDAAGRLGVAPGDYVLVRVSDTGVGMSPDLLACVTEPLFTTRAAAGGSGLGLTSVADFARGVGGAFRLQSALGEGTTATLYLPRVRPELPASARAA